MPKNEFSEREETEPKPPTFWQIVFSTLASFFGVQSQKNRERDFNHGNPVAFITAGLILTILFIAVVVSVVKIVLNTAGV